MTGLFGKIAENAVRLGTTVGFKLRKASPEILIVGGVVTVIGATVMACKSMSKVDDILDESIEDIEEINECYGDEDDIRKETAKVKLHTAGKLITTFAPAVAVGAIGVAMIFTSHGIMRKRNGAILAAYNAVDTAFRRYRERVLEEDDGRERDYGYLTGRKEQKMLRGPVELSEDEQQEMYLKDIVDDAVAEGESLMLGSRTFIFSRDTSKLWHPRSNDNLNVIRGTEDWANTMLRLKGHLYVNEVLEQLDIDPVPWGQVMGWIYNKTDKDGFIGVNLLSVEQEDAAACDDDCWGKPVVLELNFQENPILWEVREVR